MGIKDVGIAVHIQNGKVAISLNSKVDYLEFSADEALEFSYSIFEKVKELGIKSDYIILPPGVVH